jgi:hypothetical protein
MTIEKEFGNNCKNTWKFSLHNRETARAEEPKEAE